MNPLDLSWIGDIFTASDNNTAGASVNDDTTADAPQEPLLMMQNDADGTQAGLDAVILSDSMLTAGQTSDAVSSDATADTASQNEQSANETVVAAVMEEPQAVSAEDGAVMPATAEALSHISEQYIAKSVEDDVQSVSFGNQESPGRTDEASAASAHSVASKAVSGLLSRLRVAEAFNVAANPGDRLGKLQSLLSESQSMARQLFLTASADAGEQFWATLDQIRAVQSRILSSLGNAGRTASDANPASVVSATNTSRVSATPVFNGLNASAAGRSLSAGLAANRSFLG